MPTSPRHVVSLLLITIGLIVTSKATIRAQNGVTLVQKEVEKSNLPANKTKEPTKKRKKNGKKIPKARKKPAAISEEHREYQQYAITQKTAPRPAEAEPGRTSLPLKLQQGTRIGFVGNTLLERESLFGQLETLLHQSHPTHELVIRNLSWSADEVGLEPRPANFADTEQHLTHEKIDVIIAAYGFNESFADAAGLEQFNEKLSQTIQHFTSHSFNGQHAPQVVLLSPIANENIKGVAAADLNNQRIRMYSETMKQVAFDQKIGFVDLFEESEKLMSSLGTDLTINGCHLTQQGHGLVSKMIYRQLFNADPPTLSETLRLAVVKKNRQYFRRFRPLNTFYYTGGRNKSYGYLDFLPAMKSFEMMVENRDRRIWALAKGKDVPKQIDDSNIPALPDTTQSRGANRWMTAQEEQKAFKVDPRFEVNLFAGEEQFPEIAAPIQMRWDAKGRLWVSTSTTYPHVYPGNEPNDKLVILEDTDGDGKADTSTVFADNLHIPLSFEFGDGGVYVSEMPNLTFLKDTDGDDKADEHRILLSGFGTEDSHHALHDFAWTPDGDLIFRESIFHHSQVETPYGPIRQQNSGWFRYHPPSHKLISFGTYHSTNPWGVTFDDWGQHVASHPVYAAAFHSRDPVYPQQHPRPNGLRAYSGVCGHEFVDFDSFPAELQGGFIKVRYKPTNRVEIHKWNEGEFGYDEEYVGDLIFSTNLSFIPVDLRYGPRGAMYICDWYNPIKGHAQYSLRDDRRDRHSGRIWRITTKGKSLVEPPRIANASIAELLEVLKRKEYRYRYWAKRELRERDATAVEQALEKWVASLDSSDKRFRHHQLEAIWTYRWIGKQNTQLLRELLSCHNRHARAAATQQLRYWHSEMKDAEQLLRKSINDSNGIVRMEGVIAASYFGTETAFQSVMDVFRYPRGGHLAYAISCSLGSKTLRRYWENDPTSNVAKLLKQAQKTNQFQEPKPNKKEAQFDSQKNLKTVRISCVPERMQFTTKEMVCRPGQPMKLVFINPDATDHNLVIVKPGALAEVGMAANEMAKDPRNANSDFIPREKGDLILHSSPMIGPTRSASVHVMRFHAPETKGIYPYVCTFPGHWVVMNGMLVVADSDDEAQELLTQNKPKIIKEWKLTDFPQLKLKRDEKSLANGLAAFVKARCNQCHVVSGHGVNLGPDLKESVKKIRGRKLLQQMLEPSFEIHPKFQTHQFLMDNGRVIIGMIAKETETELHVMTNLLTPHNLTQVPKKQIEERFVSKVSSMPTGLLNVLTKQEILNLVSFVETDDFQIPDHLKKRSE